MKLARRFSGPGSFIAAIVLVEGIRVQRTGGTTGHYTMWGDPALILANVELVVAVEEA